MWNGKINSALALGAVAIVMTQPAFAQRSRDYTPAEFVSFLNGFGYPVPLDATLGDARVQQAIRDFQLQYNLPVDGALNPPTQNRAATLVRELQLNLNRLVRPSPQLPGTQVYGKLTDAAVRAFQRQQRLPETGIATLETRQRITTLLGQVNRPDDSGRPIPTPTLSPINPRGNIYTEAQFKSVLVGFAYDINTQKPLSELSTVKAIREIQQLYGLSETGVADQATQETLARVMRNLRNGLRVTLKSNLPITQYYDGDVAAAIRQFQTRYGLPVNGRANLALRSLIDSEARRSR